MGGKLGYTGEVAANTAIDDRPITFLEYAEKFEKYTVASQEAEAAGDRVRHLEVAEYGNALREAYPEHEAVHSSVRRLRFISRLAGVRNMVADYDQISPSAVEQAIPVGSVPMPAGVNYTIMQPRERTVYKAGPHPTFIGAGHITGELNTLAQFGAFELPSDKEPI